MMRVRAAQDAAARSAALECGGLPPLSEATCRALKT
jgi:hypothetical protein